MSESTLPLNWTGSFKISRGSPSDSAPDWKPAGDKVLNPELQSALRGANAIGHIPVIWCKPYVNSHEVDELHPNLPFDFSEYTRDYFERIPPPHTSRHGG